MIYAVNDNRRQIQSINFYSPNSPNSHYDMRILPSDYQAGQTQTLESIRVTVIY
jgi:hypothetical protein